MTPTERPRVVLVEDDPSVRRFVEMALEELPIDLVSCADVAQARAALSRQPAVLVITDLMLPGESGMSLIQALASNEALRGGARVAVFSAGVSAGVLEQLASHAVWRVLAKPVSLATLQACVLDALPNERGRPEPVGAAAVASGAAADVVASHFEGDLALYEAYRDACLLQFAADIQDGDSSVDSADWPRLERLAHSLKTVLLTLGHADSGQIARTLEGDARSAESDRARRGWTTLRETLARLIASSAPR